jgi:hypothetical protein
MRADDLFLSRKVITLTSALLLANVLLPRWALISDQAHLYGRASSPDASAIVTEARSEPADLPLTVGDHVRWSG